MIFNHRRRPLPEDITYEPDGQSYVSHHLRAVLEDQQLARALAANGLATIHARHTCAQRVDQLLQILDGLELAEDAELATSSRHEES